MDPGVKQVQLEGDNKLLGQASGQTWKKNKCLKDKVVEWETVQEQESETAQLGIKIALTQGRSKQERIDRGEWASNEPISSHTEIELNSMI